MPEADRLNPAGRYRTAIAELASGEDDGVRFRDGDMGLDAVLTRIKVDAMQKNNEDFATFDQILTLISGCNTDFPDTIP